MSSHSCWTGLRPLCFLYKHHIVLLYYSANHWHGTRPPSSGGLTQWHLTEWWTCHPAQQVKKRGPTTAQIRNAPHFCSGIWAQRGNDDVRRLNQDPGLKPGLRSHRCGESQKTRLFSFCFGSLSHKKMANKDISALWKNSHTKLLLT